MCAHVYRCIAHDINIFYRAAFGFGDMLTGRAAAVGGGREENREGRDHGELDQA